MADKDDGSTGTPGVGIATRKDDKALLAKVNASLAKLKPTDILISPELGDFSTGDFDNLPKITPLGEAAARQVADRLAQLSLPPAEYAALRKRQQVAMVPDLTPVDEIRFENLARVNPSTLLKYSERPVLDPYAVSGEVSMALLEELIATACIVSRQS